MTSRPRTIQIFLPTGDPRGIRVAELTTGIVRVIEVPRSLLEDFQKMPESQQVGVYFLVNDEAESLDVYIGQTGELGKRISQHHRSREFWNRALVAVSLTHSLTNTHALYLEWLAINAANVASRFKVENGTAGSKPHTPRPLEADCREIFESIRTLVATLGQPVFESLARAKTNPVAEFGESRQHVPSEPAGERQSDLYYSRGPAYDATAEYTEEGMVVLRGSKARREAVPSFGGSKRREALIESGALVADGDHYIFRKDVLFKSPSAAADAVRGINSNGWESWVDEAGRTLDELKRRATGS